MDFINSIIGRPNTIKTYKVLFTKWVEPLVKNPNQWDSHELKKSATFWLNQGLSPHTIKTLLLLTTRYVEYLGGPKIKASQLIKSILKLQQEEPVKALTKNESKKLIEACKSNEKMYLPIMIALHTGMRKGEIFGLTWENIDLLKGEITVKHSYNGPTKTGKSRKIPISYDLEQILVAYLPIITDNYLGNKVIVKQFDPSPQLKTICKKIGIKPINFHGLRHTFAVLALEAGRSPKKVQKVLGHSSLSTTLEIYWSSTREEKLDMGFLK